MLSSQKGVAMLRRLFRDYRRYILLFVISMICALVSTGLALLVPVLMGQGMDMIIGINNVDFDGLIIVIKEMALAIVISSVFLWIMNGINNRIVYGISTDLRKRAFTSFVDAEYKVIDSHSEGDIVSRIIVDCDGISEGLLLGFNQFFVGIVTIIITFCFMLSISLYLAIAVLILTPLSLLVARFISRKCNTYFASQAKARGELTELSSDIISMKQIINDEEAEGYFADKFCEKNEENERVSRKAIFYSSLTNPLTRLVNAICYAAVTFGGGFLAIKGNITIGGLTSFLAYASQFAKPFNDISSVVTELQNSFVCIDRIYELIDCKSEHIEDSLKDEKEIESEVVFNHVAFGYSNEKIIDDVTFKVPKGKKMGIVGPTGCGKTTIIKLLLKYYDYWEGEILLGGVNIRDIPVDKVRGMMGLMLQETFLVSGTIMDNICMGNTTASYEDVVKAAKECNAHEFIMSLPEGYNTKVKEGNLSEGQRQLICITRLMLRDSQIILLDEATSSIDILNEQIIQEAFRKIMKNKTTIVVAHRLSTIMDSDIILVVKDGKIEEIGKHHELLSNKGFYYRLYESQKR